MALPRSLRVPAQPLRPRGRWPGRRGPEQAQAGSTLHAQHDQAGRGMQAVEQPGLQTSHLQGSSAQRADDFST